MTNEDDAHSPEEPSAPLPLASPPPGRPMSDAMRDLVTALARQAAGEDLADLVRGAEESARKIGCGDDPQQS